MYLYYILNCINKTSFPPSFDLVSLPMMQGTLPVDSSKKLSLYIHYTRGTRPYFFNHDQRTCISL